jgi:hypothetical protein
MRTAKTRRELHHSPLRDLNGHGWAGRRSGSGAAWFQPLIVCDRRSTETYSSQRLSPPSALQNQGQISSVLGEQTTGGRWITCTPNARPIGRASLRGWVV